MKLRYKPDWEACCDRYQAWWNHQAIGRCGLAVTAPNATAASQQPPSPPSDPIQRWTDLDFIAAANTHALTTTYYGGEAFPSWHGGYPGHTAIPSFLGCPVHLDQRTGWWDPILNDDVLDVSHLKIDKTGEWWTFAVRLLERAVEECRGNAIPSIGAFGGCGDTLAALRGTDRLLYDVMDQPENVVEAEIRLMEMWCEVFDCFHEIISGVGTGMTCWFHLWSPGKFYAAQNDFSYMISPKMFEELFLPVIERQTQFLDHTVYHVDGVNAFDHVPALCDLPDLQALQILPGAGKPSPLHYLDTLKYVQKRGKNLHISIPANEVETALQHLSPEGLMIATSCASRAEADTLLNKAESWSAKVPARHS